MRVFLIGIDGLQFVSDPAYVPVGVTEVALDARAIGASPRDLVWDGTAVRSRIHVATWHIDADGQWHALPGMGRQPLAVAWGTPIGRDAAGTWAPLSAAARLAPLIRAECSRRVDAVFDGRRNSILSYAIALNGRVSIGLAAGQAIAQSLTAEEQADVALIWALDAWETAMIAARETLSAAADASFADDAHWPAPPAGLTPEWLKGF